MGLEFKSLGIFGGMPGILIVVEAAVAKPMVDLVKYKI